MDFMCPIVIKKANAKMKTLSRDIFPMPYLHSRNQNSISTKKLNLRCLTGFEYASAAQAAGTFALPHLNGTFLVI